MKTEHIEVGKDRKLALITGGSSGIGYALAKQFYRQGYSLVLVGRDERKLRQAAARLVNSDTSNSYRNASGEKHGRQQYDRQSGGIVETVSCDLTRQEECVRLHELYRDRIVDVLVNCAGFGVHGDFVGTDGQKETEMLDVNCRAVHLLMKWFLQDMQKRGGGTILNVASSAGLVPGGPYMAAYYATKSYVVSLTRSVAEELRAQKSPVYVAALCPGPVDTPFFGRAGIGTAGAAASPDTVAGAAMRGMEKRKTVIIPGVSNQLACMAAKVLPAGMILKVNRKIQERKKR
ncbi:MAG: SDR family oxidoreductase [Lachnospiraceae bacterium]|nr:SDR family oxidoreductase [Lachnospiraceae bacterium]